MLSSGPISSHPLSSESSTTAFFETSSVAGAATSTTVEFTISLSDSLVTSSSTDDSIALGDSSICYTASAVETNCDFETASTAVSTCASTDSVTATFSVSDSLVAESSHLDATDFINTTYSVAASTTSTEIDFDTLSALASSSEFAASVTAGFSTSSTEIVSSSFVADFDCSGDSTCYTASTTSVLSDNASFTTASTLVTASTTTADTVSDFSTTTTLVTSSETSTGVVASFASASMLGAVSSYPGESSTVWNINSETGAAWVYTNYPFNSVCDLNGMILAAGSGGIYVVDQTTDAGSDVIAEAKSGLIDFNSQALKNILSVDVLGQFASAPVIKVSETGTGALREWHYKSAYPVDSAHKEHVIKTGRGLRSRYYGIAIQVRGTATVERINPQMVQLKTRH